MIGNGPKPRIHSSRRDQHTIMSSAYAKTNWAMISGAKWYTSRQYQPQYA